MQIASARPTTLIARRATSTWAEAHPAPKDMVSFSGVAGQLNRRLREGGWVMLGGVGLFAGLGAGVGALFAAPVTGALKGLGCLTLSATASEIMENRQLESKIFNWSKTMPGDEATPRDLDSEAFRNKALFAANLATNALVVAGLGAGLGAIIAGTPGAVLGGGGILIAGAFAELLTGQ